MMMMMMMMMNLNRIELDDTDGVTGDEIRINEKTIDGTLEEVAGSEDLNHNDNHESNEDNGSNNKFDNYESNDKIPVRRSERIKKRLKDINPDDIGENDDAKDKDYKG